MRGKHSCRTVSNRGEAEEADGDSNRLRNRGGTPRRRRSSYFERSITPICAGQNDIGNTATPMTARMSKGGKQGDGSIAVEPAMDVNHVGQAMLHMANLPLQSNLLTMMIKVSKMPFEGRG